MKSEISISPLEIAILIDWIATLDPQPRQVRIVATPTGIGTHLRAEVEQGEGEGRWKDLTDYESW